MNLKMSDVVLLPQIDSFAKPKENEQYERKAFNNKISHLPVKSFQTIIDSLLSPKYEMSNDLCEDFNNSSNIKYERQDSSPEETVITYDSVELSIPPDQNFEQVCRTYAV